MEKMMTFPAGIKFKYEWRKYQARVLKELEVYLENGSLHVIAPPGSGKTVLGLEVMLRLNGPTLVLAPTLAIRNQWVDRFCELFLQTQEVPSWISCDIRKPGFMTVSTYQGLHAACNKLTEEEKEFEEEEGEKLNSNLYTDEIIDGLKRQGVKTVVLDEAHHLRNEWWNSLNRIKKRLSPTIIGLTATPPYDVTAGEWGRYIDLNGTVDAEITVPELIQEEDLCPHQDYVYFSLPSPEEYDKINQFRGNIDKLFEEIRQDPVFIEAISTYPAWVDPIKNQEWVYDNMSCYSATLIFLNSIGQKISSRHLEMIGCEKIKIPYFDYVWMEELLEFYLHREKVFFSSYQEHRLSLENKLLRWGAMEKKQINFRYNGRLMNTLTSSIGKLNSIARIAGFESDQLREQTRMVILTDYIRQEYLVSTPQNNLELDRIGVMPIFEKLRRDGIGIKGLGVLTGSIVIVPLETLDVLEEELKKVNVDRVVLKPLAYDPDYVQVNLTKELKNEIIRVVTRIFQEGKIKILIGTKSLLGEGWDAPAINTLILASFVGSYVSSNQMRGRAIRVEKGNAGKTGNIWHLVCVDPTSPSGGEDLELLRRRFKGFIGISCRENGGIENGIERLEIPDPLVNREEIERRNTRSFSEAADRRMLRQRWEIALKNGVNLVEEMKIPFREERDFRPLPKMYLNRTLAYLFTEVGILIAIFGEGLLQSAGRGAFRNVKTTSDWAWVALGIGVSAFCFFGHKMMKACYLYFKYRDISKDICQIGDTVVNVLCEEKVFQTPVSDLSVEAIMDDSGAVFCYLQGGTSYEKSAFISTMREIVSPVNNPRYVIVRRSLLLWCIRQKDYHAVPELLGKKKSSAEKFRLVWREKVGRCQLMFTRTLEGRKFLLKCRGQSLAARLSDQVQQVNKWR